MYELKSGFILSLIAFIFINIEYAVGLHGAYIKYYTYTSFIYMTIPPIFFIIALSYKKKQLGDQAKFKYLLRSGMYISLFNALFYLPLLGLFLSWINPDFFQARLNLSEQRAREIFFEVEQLEMVMKRQKEFFNLKAYLQQSFITNILTGIFLSTVMAIAIKKKL